MARACDTPWQERRNRAVVSRLITDAAESGFSVYLNKVVVCESVWVLESACGYPRDTIADVLEKLLLTQQIESEERDHVWRSLRRYREGTADRADDPTALLLLALGGATVLRAGEGEVG